MKNVKYMYLHTCCEFCCFVAVQCCVNSNSHIFIPLLIQHRQVN